MTPTIQTLQVIKRITTLLDDKESLTKLLSNATSYHSKIEEAILEVAASSSPDGIKTLKANLINAYAHTFKEMSARRIFIEIHTLEQELKDLDSDAKSEFGNYGILLVMLSELTENYEQFLRSSTEFTTLKVINSAHALFYNIYTVINFSHFIDGILDPFVPNTFGYDEFSLQLSSDSNFSQVLTKLIALKTTYSELCQLLSVSMSEYPLQIRHVESGSLWINLFGESKVVALLVKLIESSATFLYRRYTLEGKISSIPKQVQSVESILQLTQRLEEQGIDTSTIKDNLQKSLIIISAEMNSLLAGEPSVTINNQVISVGDSLSQKYITESKHLLLEDGSQNTP